MRSLVGLPAEAGDSGEAELDSLAPPPLPSLSVEGKLTMPETREARVDGGVKAAFSDGELAGMFSLSSTFDMMSSFGIKCKMKRDLIVYGMQC